MDETERDCIEEFKINLLNGDTLDKAMKSAKFVYDCTDQQRQNVEAHILEGVRNL